MTGQQFKTVRIELGMTQEELAEAIQVTVRTIQRVESTSGEIQYRYTLAIGNAKSKNIG